jgi:uncharacterized membrane protein YcaP (DUF421 family)
MAATIVRTAILYFLLIFAIRLMGKRQIGDMQPGELVITILISEIAAVPIQDLTQPVLTGVVAVFTLIFLEIAISVLTMKALPLRKFFYGDSCIIIKNGVLDQKMLKKLRVTGPDLLEVLRNQNVFNLEDVAYAILETNGQLSVLLKPEKQNVTIENFSGKQPDDNLPSIVISDGKFIKENLLEINKTKSEISKLLTSKSIAVKDIFMMLCDSEGNFDIIRKEEK